MNQQHVVTFEPDGKIEYMEKHDDSLDLRHLGEHTIERATDIKYDQASKTWSVLLCGREEEPHPKVSRDFQTYEVARQFEVEWLQLCALSRTEPLSNKGYVCAGLARAKVKR